MEDTKQYKELENVKIWSQSEDPKWFRLAYRGNVLENNGQIKNTNGNKYTNNNFICYIVLQMKGYKIENQRENIPFNHPFKYTGMNYEVQWQLPDCRFRNANERKYGLIEETKEYIKAHMDRVSENIPFREIMRNLRDEYYRTFGHKIHMKFYHNIKNVSNCILF